MFYDVLMEKKAHREKLASYKFDRAATIKRMKLERLQGGNPSSGRAMADKAYQAYAAGQTRSNKNNLLNAYHALKGK